MKLLLVASLAFAQSGDHTQSNFAFNQRTVALNLEQKDFETIYRTDQVPDTCYRDEIQGTRTECHTEIERICNTRYEELCSHI